MDFNQLLASAKQNAERSSKEVHKISNEVKHEKNESRRQLEAEKAARIEMQRRKAEKEKEIARARAERQEEERRRNFTIPKRNEGSSNSSSTVNAAAVRAFAEKQKAEKEAKEKKQEAEKQRLMKLRMQANGGKATKKMGKHFGLDVIDLQTRFGGNNEHLEVLQKRKYKEEEEQDMEADKYRSGVYKALAAKQKNEESLRNTVSGPHRVSTSKSNSLAGLCSRHERTRDTFSPPKDGKKPINQRNEQVVEKKKIQAAAPVDFNSLMNAARDRLEGKKVDMEQFKARPAQAAPIPKNKPSSSSNGANGAGATQKSGLSQADRDRLREKERLREKAERQKEKEKEAEKQRIREKERAKNQAAHAQSSQKYRDNGKSSLSSNDRNGTEQKKKDFRAPAVRKPFTKGPTPPPLIPAAIPGKKYLPGDVRYKEQMAMMKKSGNSGATSSSTTSSGANRDRILAVREAEREREREREKQRSLKRAREEKSMKEYEREQKIRKIGSSSSSSNGKSSSSSKIGQSYEARRMAELRMQQQKEKERKKKKSNGRESGSFYRGGDDNTDEEMDEDEYDDDYDSEMDDFIDDTEVDFDNVNRKEFVDTLKKINRTYDTDKWSRREKMISERDMVSDYRRIQSEESYSKRAGFMEDLREATKGRSVRL